MNIKKNIPNAFTLFNLVFGCFAIAYAFNNDLFNAAIFIFLAALSDFLDGTVARALNVSSELGKQLDSLADIVSFGVAPAFIIYHLFENSYNFYDTIKIIQISSFLIPVFSAIRLAKFNIDTRQKNQFIGLPVPANAILIASFPMIYNQESPDMTWLSHLIVNSWFLFGFSIVFSILLVSEIPMFSLKFKRYSWKGNQVRYVFVVLSLVLLILYYFKAVPIIILLYLLISLFYSFSGKLTN